MRFTKTESHPHLATKFVKKFCFLPRYIQSHWIWFETYYTAYVWDFHNLKTYQKFITYEQSKNYSKGVALRDYELFNNSTHSWKPIDYSPNRLPEDSEVKKWLIENSPLMNAMKE